MAYNLGTEENPLIAFVAAFEAAAKVAELLYEVTETDDTQVNASEQAKVLMDVALIDPETINTPSRAWL